MCPRVNCEVVQIIDRGLKLDWVRENVLADEKMGCMFVVLGEEVVESTRRLKKKAFNPRRQVVQRKRDLLSAGHRQS